MSGYHACKECGCTEFVRIESFRILDYWAIQDIYAPEYEIRCKQCNHPLKMVIHEGTARFVG